MRLQSSLSRCPFLLPSTLGCASDVLGVGMSLLVRVLSLCFATLLLANAVSAQAMAPKELFGSEQRFRAIAYRFPEFVDVSVNDKVLPPLCVLARDLPLIAQSGATVVYTQGHVPEDGDHIFLNLLASTGLSWVAAYPLPLDVDPSLSLLEQRSQILARFAAFAERFAGNPNLRGVVLDFGKQHLAASAQLANEFAAILEAYFPTQTPRLGHVAYAATALERTPIGISFWLYRFEDSLPASLARIQLQQRTTLPIVFDLSSVAGQLVPQNSTGNSPLTSSWNTYLQDFAGSDMRIPLLPLHFQRTSDVTAGTTTAAANTPYAASNSTAYLSAADALFRLSSDAAGFEALLPSPFLAPQRNFWGADALEDHAGAPRIESVTNSASGQRDLAPGTRFTIEGSMFRRADTALTQPAWPLHAAGVCVCLGDRPVPVGVLQANRVSAQIPWLTTKGAKLLRLLREGISSQPQSLDLLDHAPGLFEDGITLIQTACGPTESPGLKVGEPLSLRVTGAGPLNSIAKDLSLTLDGVSMPIVGVGLDSAEPGIAIVNTQVPAKSGSAMTSGLSIRRGGRNSNVVPISYAGNTRPTIALSAERSAIQIQPNGSALPLTIQTKGVNGYCGQIDFEIMGLPTGVSATISSITSGQFATLQLRAATNAATVDEHLFYLYALPRGGDLQVLPLQLKVLPRTGSVQLTVQSAGYAAGSTASIYWRGDLLAPTGMANQRGLYLLIVNPSTGVFSAVESYDIFDKAEESARLESRLQALPTGTMVAMAITDDATLEMQPSLRSLIQSRLGSRSIANLGYQHSWAIISAIGAATPLAEATSADQIVAVQTALQLPNF